MRPALREVIGSGNFGVVHRGIDPVHGEVAVKVFRQWTDEEPDAWEERRRELLGEGQRLSTAQHEHVLRVFSICESEDRKQVMLVLEMCSGGSVAGLYEKGPIPIERVREIATEALHGLTALHACDLLHRDIRPANILLHGSGRAKLGDFGLVTERDALGYAERVGYIDHFAPEVHELAVMSVRSDIWAFGMTLYRMLHGAAWCAEAGKPRDAVVAGGYAKKLLWLPHVPQGWRRLIRKAMHDDRESRFPSARALLDAVGALPLTQNWNTVVGRTKVAWSATKSNRRLEVVWNRSTNEWCAMSHPVGDGRSRKLGGSQSVRDLEAFLAKEP